MMKITWSKNCCCDKLEDHGMCAMLKAMIVVNTARRRTGSCSR